MPGETSAIRGFAKLRPSFPSEVTKSDVKVSSEKVSATVNGVDSSFSFDGSYSSEAKSRTVYKEKCEPLLHRVVEGTNVSLIAVGTTGSGKSYFMNGMEEDPGIAPCMIHGLFQVIERMRNKEFFVTCSYLEEMDDKLTDLLNPHTGNMKIRTGRGSKVYVDGLCALVAQDAKQLLQYFEQGTRARKMGSSEARSHKERSSSLFYIRVEQREPGHTNIGLTSTLLLADLAGLESGACDELVNCLAALRNKKPPTYSNSKLSKLLEESIGGNCVTSFFCLLHPNGDQNAPTFNLSQTVKGLKNSVLINFDETEKTVRDLRDEISILREQISKNPNANKEDIMRLQDLVKELQIVKQQTWEERQKLSLKYEEERKQNLANGGILEWVMNAKQRGQQQIQEKILALQKEKEQLSQEYKVKKEEVTALKEQLQKHIADYSKINESEKRSDSETKTRVNAIHKLKEKLKEASEEQKALKTSLQDIHEQLRGEREEAGSKSFATKGSTELAWLAAAEERRKMEVENESLVADELERMKLEVEHEIADIKMHMVEGKTYTAQEYSDLEIRVAELNHEKPVTALEIQSLKQEKKHLQHALDELHKQAKLELEKQQMQHFQTFRNYREVFEKQKGVLEKRYRELLDESIQDAVFLSARNEELLNENGQLRQEIAALQDRLSAGGGN